MSQDPFLRASRRWAATLASFALALVGCGEPSASSVPATSTEPTCPAASVDVPTTAGYPSSEVLERRVRELVTRDFDAHACVVRVVARRESMLVEASHEGETIRARVSASLGSPTESLAPHVAAHRLLHTLIDASAESALSTGRIVALSFSDHGAICYRAVGQDAQCVRTAPVLGFDAATEPSVRRVIVRALSALSASMGTESELLLGDAATLTVRTGPLQPARALGTPPPELDRFARVRAADAEAATVAAEPAAQSLAQAMPPGASTVRLDTRTIGATRVALLSRCEGMIPHCVSMVATREGATLRIAPSFASDPARIDAVEDAAALAPGALRVRIREAGFHEGSASELFVLATGGALDVHAIALGSETERGEEETITEGCYRTLAIEAPSRVRLSDAHGWSGSRSDARGWRVVPSTTCAPEAVMCLDAAAGFAPCP